MIADLLHYRSAIFQNRTKMKQFVTLLLIVLFNVPVVQAQNFLNNLQKDVPGHGTVTVQESQDIDELVNGKQTVVTHKVQTEQPVKKPISQHSTTVKKEDADKVVAHDIARGTTTHEPTHVTTPKNEATTKPKTTETEDTDFDIDIPTVDLRKKVMRKSYKVTGFRVQAYAGGNGRSDRQKAQNIGNDIKMNYPDQPIYVHFYSPRWICRVGNYRSYEEAHRMLINVQRLGYRQACIVKGKISIQY